MVEVFKTDVKCPFIAQQIIADMLVRFIDVEVSFDLEDRDRVLRVSARQILIPIQSDVRQIFENYKSFAEVLLDSGDELLTDYPSNDSANEISIKALMSLF